MTQEFKLLSELNKNQEVFQYIENKAEKELFLLRDKFNEVIGEVYMQEMNLKNSLDQLKLKKT